MLPFVDAFKNLPFLPSIFGKVLTVANDIHNDDCDHDDNDDDDDDDENENEDKDDNGVIGDVMNGMLFLVNDVNVITFIYGKRLHLWLLLPYMYMFEGFCKLCDGSSSSSSSSISGSNSCSPITDNNSSSNANI
ncbi:hypothetical protein GQX74_012489 [Glossina fuscipes]|nr:hypothetical protein GQX74_012489 [Glossina fuscipes]